MAKTARELEASCFRPFVVHMLSGLVCSDRHCPCPCWSAGWSVQKVSERAILISLSNPAYQGIAPGWTSLRQAKALAYLSQHLLTSQKLLAFVNNLIVFSSFSEGGFPVCIFFFSFYCGMRYRPSTKHKTYKSRLLLKKRQSFYRAPARFFFLFLLLLIWAREMTTFCTLLFLRA